MILQEILALSQLEFQPFQGVAQLVLSFLILVEKMSILVKFWTILILKKKILNYLLLWEKVYQELL